MPSTNAPGRTLPYLRVQKGTDQSIASDVTLGDDDELLLPVAANSEYELECNIWCQGETGNSVLTITWAGPSGATLQWTYDCLSSTATGTTGSVSRQVLQFGSEASTICFSANDTWSTCRGFLSVGATAGTLKLQWRQNVSTANATKVLAGSWLRLLQVS